MKRKTLNVLLAFILIALSFCIYIKPITSLKDIRNLMQ